VVKSDGLRFATHPRKHYVKRAADTRSMVDLRPHQKLKIQTDLVKGTITGAGSQVHQQ
jgi:hypothetical protein